MKLSIQMGEGYHTWNLKSSIEIETDNYPELAGKTPEEMAEYITRNASSMKSSENTEAEEWSLYDELYEQETVTSKEKNYETHVYLTEKMK